MRLDQFARTADWHAIPEAERTAWQQVAARTHGFATLANVATVLGVALVILGLIWVWQGHLMSGVIAIAVGRLCDLLDGFLARLTRTESSVGESLDAGFDKVAVLCAGVVLAATHIVPLLIIGAIAVEQVAVFGMSAYAKAHHGTLHPTKEGKYTTAVIWMAVVIYLLAAGIEHTHAGYGFLHAAGFTFSCVAVGMGVIAVIRYGKALHTVTRSKA